MSRPCTVSLHGEITASPERFAAELVPIGVMHVGDGEPDLALANCPRCSSTLAREVKPCS